MGYASGSGLTRRVIGPVDTLLKMVLPRTSLFAVVYRPAGFDAGPPFSPQHIYFGTQPHSLPRAVVLSRISHLPLLRH
jgi:hypothetical protein